MAEDRRPYDTERDPGVVELDDARTEVEALRREAALLRQTANGPKPGDPEFDPEAHARHAEGYAQ